MGAVKLLKKHRIIIIFAAGLLLRLGLSVVNYNGDVTNYHIPWAQYLKENGGGNFYNYSNNNSSLSSAIYPPLSIFFFYSCLLFFTAVGNIIWKINLLVPFFPSKLVFLWENQKNILPAFMKIPAILSDIGIAYLIFLFAKKIVKKKGSSLPLIGACLVLFNPAFFYNSSYWGQIESLPLFFVLGAFYLLIYRKRHILSVVFMTLAILSKQTAVIFIPLYGLIFIRKLSIKKLFGSIVSSLAVFLVVFFPFIGKNNLLTYPFTTYWNRIMTAFGSEYLTAHAFNFWGLMYGLGHIPDSRITLFGLSVRWWSLIYVCFIIWTILYILHKRKYRINDILSAGYLIPMAIFLFSTRMHERHLEPALPFLLLATIINRKLFWVFIFVSLFHFLNLYEGWWSPPVRIIIDIFSNKFIINFLIVSMIFLSICLLFRYVYEDNKRV